MEDKRNKKDRSKKDKAFVAVVTGLSSNQAGQLMNEVRKSKDRHAPNSRGTIAVGNQDYVGKMIQKKDRDTKKITSKNTQKTKK